METRASLHNPYIQVLSARLGECKLGGSGEVRFNSPFTPPGKDDDRKFHLYVNPSKRTFFDFRSGTSGSLSYLFRLLGEDYLAEPTPPPPDDIDVLKERLAALSPPPWKTPRANLPEWYHQITPGGRVHNYLLGRGVNDSDIEFYKLGEGLDFYDGWVVIPSFDQYRRCDYWVARRTYEGGSRAKYDNPEVERKYHVAFLHNAVVEGDGAVILCEGVFSAIVAGRSACASLGKFVTNTQLALMLQSGVKTIRLALDGDALKETLDTAGRALRMGFTVTIIPLPVEQDPADMGRAAFFDLIRREERLVDVPDLMRTRVETLL
jgi:hypothetical protein